MAHKSYDNGFKEMIVGLMQSGMGRKSFGDAYGLNFGRVERWKLEYMERKDSFSNKVPP